MSTASIEYAWADADDLPALRDLLASHDLPTADLALQRQRFVVVKLDSQILAVAGIEVHGPDALLRSVCVRESERGRGLAARACELIEAYARTLGLTHCYLLTTTAQAYFERRGFAVWAREAAPAAIRASAEFRALCPASAVCMRRSLDA